jgi:hypothetical protein
MNSQDSLEKILSEFNDVYAELNKFQDEQERMRNAEEIIGKLGNPLTKVPENLLTIMKTIRDDLENQENLTNFKSLNKTEQRIILRAIEMFLLITPSDEEAKKGIEKIKPLMKD